MWRQAKIRSVKREFIQKLKESVEKSKERKEEGGKLFQRLATKFMMMGENKDDDSISIHYSEE